MFEWIRREPVLVYQLVAAIFATLVAFGVDLSKPQTAALLGLSTAAVSLFVRSKVTPLDKQG